MDADGGIQGDTRRVCGVLYNDENSLCRLIELPVDTMIHSTNYKAS